MKSTFQARVGIIFFVIGKFIRFLMFFFLIFFLVSKTKVIQGYNTNQAILFYLTFNIIDTVSQLLFREVYRFRYLVTSGNFDTVLIKPYHPFLRILVGGVDILDLFMLIPYILLTSFFAIQSTALQSTNIVLYLSLMINSLLIATSFHIIVLALGILTSQVDHMIMIYRDTTSLGRFPMEIYKEPIRSIFTFIIPVGVMMTFPSRALFGLLNTQLIFISFLLGIFMFFASLKLWDFSVKKYQSGGG